MNKSFLFILLFVFIVALIFYVKADFGADSPTGSAIKSSDAIKATVFKTQACGCCSNYVSELKSQGFDVEVVNLKDMTPVKSKYQIARDMESCHTVAIQNYFVEGHVPIKAIQKLVSEQPDIDGIALPGMPMGAPGMTGKKTGSFEIMAVKDGQPQGVFVSI